MCLSSREAESSHNHVPQNKKTSGAKGESFADVFLSRSWREDPASSIKSLHTMAKEEAFPAVEREMQGREGRGGWTPGKIRAAFSNREAGRGCDAR